MVRIHRCSTAAVPVHVAFSYVADFNHLPEWLYGLQRVRSTNDVKSGLGAQFEAAIKLGATLRSTVEITGYEEDRLVATESRAGIDNQSSWRFRALGDELTEIDTTMDYHLPGGLAGRALARAIEPFVGIAVANSEDNLRSILETRHQKAKTQRP